ncbi:MAG: protein kinase [Chloroflexi bacterium]|nr:protein kinase [Chloroflexota bacterium]
MININDNPKVSMADPLLGRTLEGYKFLSLLGSGGFGAVYLAQHPRLDLQVAVKYIRMDGTPDELVDAEHEIKILSSLKHRGVVQIYDAFRYEHYQLIMMEFVGGGTMDDLIEKLGRVDLPTALEAMIQVADALHYIHNRGVLHLDLKPGNILLDTQDGEPFPRFVLTDFGIARFVQPSGHVTMFGGTPAYMAPEQFGFGEDKPDRRSDIYQFGIILYELVAGKMPFEGRNFVDYAQKHAYETPPPPSAHAPNVPLALDDIVLKALEKSPADRFQSVGEVAHALHSLRLSMTPPQNDLVPQQVMQFARERKAQVSMRLSQMPASPLTLAQAAAPTVPQAAQQPLPQSTSGLNLLLLKPDGTQENVTFYKSPIIIGRSKEADLSLEQKTVSRRHTQIDLDSSGALYVTDLNSAHGTYLDSARVLPNERTLWQRSKHLLIEGYVLQVVGQPALYAAPAGQQAAPVAEPVRPAPAPPQTALRHSEVAQLLEDLQAQRKQPHLQVNVTPKVVYVEMGKPQPIWVTVQPMDTPSARYELFVAPGPGIDARWFTVSAPKVVSAGQSETFEVVIAAPGIDVVGGQKYEMIIEVRADNPEIPSALQVVKLSVVPFMRFNIALNPGEVSHARRGRAGVIVTNNGNYADIFSIQTQAPDRLRVRPKQAEVELQPGKFKLVPLQFKPTRDAYKEDRLLFSVIVTSKAGMTERANGSYLLPRRRHLPLLPLLLLAIVIAVLINWLVFNTPPAAQLDYFLNQVNTLRQVIADFLQGLGR